MAIAGRDFQRARHGDAVVLRAGFVEHARGARQQRVGDVLVEARLDDQDAQRLSRFVAALDGALVLFWQSFWP